MTENNEDRDVDRVDGEPEYEDDGIAEVNEDVEPSAVDVVVDWLFYSRLRYVLALGFLAAGIAAMVYTAGLQRWMFLSTATFFFAFIVEYPYVDRWLDRFIDDHGAIVEDVDPPDGRDKAVYEMGSLAVARLRITEGVAHSLTTVADGYYQVREYSIEEHEARGHWKAMVPHVELERWHHKVDEVKSWLSPLAQKAVELEAQLDARSIDRATKYSAKGLAHIERALQPSVDIEDERSVFESDSVELEFERSRRVDEDRHDEFGRKLDRGGEREPRGRGGRQRGENNA